MRVSAVIMADKTGILIIDDDANLRRTLSDILRAQGYEAHAAGNGIEGLDLLKQQTIHLALVDLRLPDISGLEVLEKIKADYPSIEAIILTGNATLDSAIEATNRGAFSYLQKPYDMDQLLLHIRRAIEKRQAEEAREKLIRELREALARIKTLSGMLPICMSCKKIRDDKGYWNQIEAYISEHSEAEFSHGLCPECAKKLYPEYYNEK